MSTRTMVVVKTEFDGMHCWSDCPIDAVDFLNNPHRHKFYVTVKMEVGHDDRDIEFFMLKSDMDTFIGSLRKFKNSPTIKDLGSSSCEMLANRMITFLVETYSVNKIFCSVFEDNENGAEVYWEVD